MSEKPELGTIGWFDLTVADAKPVADFYSKVVGWKIQETPVDDYHDYTMCDPVSDVPRSGVCHKKGQNADLPSQWMMYIYVDNLEERCQTVISEGGKVLRDPSPPASYGRFAVIQDPAGAVLALFESA